MEEDRTVWNTDAISGQGFFGLGFLSGMLIFLLMFLACALAYFILRQVCHHQKYIHSNMVTTLRMARSHTSRQGTQEEGERVNNENKDKTFDRIV